VNLSSFSTENTLDRTFAGTLCDSRHTCAGFLLDSPCGLRFLQLCHPTRWNCRLKKDRLLPAEKSWQITVVRFNANRVLTQTGSNEIEKRGMFIKIYILKLDAMSQVWRQWRMVLLRHFVDNFNIWSDGNSPFFLSVSRRFSSRKSDQIMVDRPGILEESFQHLPFEPLSRRALGIAYANPEIKWITSELKGVLRLLLLPRGLHSKIFTFSAHRRMDI